MVEHMKVLYAYDGSRCADEVADDLKRAGLPKTTEVLVFSATELWLPPPSMLDVMGGAPPHHGERELTSATALALSACDRLRTAFPDWNVSSKGDLGDPAARILDEATSWRADLIVLGSHGHTALGRLVLGSVSQKVANEAPCSVRVARVSEPKSGPVRLVLAMNGSIGSDAAVDEVARRSWPEGTTVEMVAFCGPYASLGGEIERGIAHIHEIHARAADRLKSTGLSVTSTVREGVPKRDLAETARRLDADCIFLGTRDLNKIGRFLLGSVSTAVLNRAPCSVEIVRGR
jgi:nucleotide-binding universal stress UspA family protein